MCDRPSSLVFNQVGREEASCDRDMSMSRGLQACPKAPLLCGVSHCAGGNPMHGGSLRLPARLMRACHDKKPSLCGAGGP